MCGRFSIPDQELVMLDVFGDKLKAKWKERFNVAPSQDIPAIKSPTEFSMIRWGLIPSWAKELSIGNKMINARAETVSEKPSFRSAFKKRRCLIISNGFFEWKKEGSKKQPYYIFMKGHEPFCFAGLWEKWVSPEGEVIESGTILTTDANDLLQSIHNRMPVIIPKEKYFSWLSPETSDTELKKLLIPHPSAEMDFYPVSTLVNKPSNDLRECIEEMRSS